MTVALSQVCKFTAYSSFVIASVDFHWKERRTGIMNFKGS
jgi:hypothetical protein